MANPAKKTPPADALAKAIRWQEDCRADFFAKATSTPRRAEGVALADAGTALLRSAETEPAPRAKARLLIDAMGRFRAALAKDPYNPQASFGLAIAYARARQKGCALALLKRLALVDANGTLATDATNVVSAALEERTFAPFRKEADAALGR